MQCLLYSENMANTKYCPTTILSAYRSFIVLGVPQICASRDSSEQENLRVFWVV